MGLPWSDAIKSVVDDSLGKIVDKGLAFIQDPVQKAEYEKAMRTLDLTEMQQQLAVALEEAKSNDKFTERARPFILWVCGVAFAYSFLVQPFLVCIVRIWIKDFSGPALDMASLLAITTGMLGLSYHRSQDKRALISANSP